jgi:transcriptional regulator with XRE-family HTH domain
VNDEDKPQNAGYRVRVARNCFGESQRKFAQKISINQSVLSEVENNKKEPSERLLSRMNLVYGIREEWIISGEGEMLGKSNQPSKIEERFKIIRSRTGLTQKEFATKYGLKLGRVQHLESGEVQKFNDREIVLFLDLGYDALWLLTGESREDTKVRPPKYDKKLLRAIIFYVEDYIHMKKIRLTADVKADVIFSFWEHLSIDNTITDKEMRKFIESSIEMVVSMIDKGGK